MRSLFTWLAISAALLTGCSQSNPAGNAPTAAKSASAKAPTTKDATITSAMSAAPASVSKDATILGFDSKGGMQTLRKGTNGWTCMPDTPQTPGPDPMCVDKGGMAWAMAWLTHKNPPPGTMGFGYMLQGGSDASNADPFATKPAAGKSWVTTGPHVMVFNIGSNYAGYPTTPANTKAPYVMFPNTPYAHLMIPVS